MRLYNIIILHVLLNLILIHLMTNPFFHFRDICRSSRTEPPDLVGIMRVTDDMIDSLVCPPPPTDPPVMSEEMITGLIVPAPGWSKYFIQRLVFKTKRIPPCFGLTPK